MSKHLSEAQRALYAGGEMNWLARHGAARHVAVCEPCRAGVNEFYALRDELGEMSRDPGPMKNSWGSLEAEIKANIHLGIEVGEIASHTWRQPAFRLSGALTAAASLAVILAAGVWMNLPHRGPAVSHPNVDSAAVLESTGGGIQMRQGADVFGVMNAQGADAITTVSVRGEMRSRYVEDSGVTINNVYAQ